MESTLCAYAHRQGSSYIAPLFAIWVLLLHAMACSFRCSAAPCPERQTASRMEDCVRSTWQRDQQACQQRGDSTCSMMSVSTSTRSTSNHLPSPAV